MYYIYVLLSEKDNKFYIGYTNNIENRINEHIKGLVPSTKYRRPLELVYYEAFKYKQNAIEQELFYKTGQGRRVLNKRLKNIKDISVTRGGGVVNRNRL